MHCSGNLYAYTYVVCDCVYSAFHAVAFNPQLPLKTDSRRGKNNTHKSQAGVHCEAANSTAWSSQLKFDFDGFTGRKVKKNNLKTI